MWARGDVRVAAFIAASLVGCSSGGEVQRTGTPDGGTTTGASSVQPLIDALCGGARTCCGRAGYPAEPLADCESEVVRQIHSFQGVLDGTVLVDASRIAACASAYDAAGSSCSYPASAESNCSGMFSGTLAEGESCTRAEQCTRTGSAVMCFKDSSSVPNPPTGVCRAIARAASGQPCSVSGGKNFYGTTYTTAEPNAPLAYCAESDGLTCSYVTHTCIPLAALGAACVGTSDCIPEAYCDTTCKARKPLGSSCTSSNECMPLLACENGACAPLGVASDKLCGGDYN